MLIKLLIFSFDEILVNFNEKIINFYVNQINISNLFIIIKVSRKINLFTEIKNAIVLLLFYNKNIINFILI